ncbi:hypothetical protein B0T22DRAFT_467613 [Podospora appendiculata]|uniref:Secreted protein n=1 Tax=Podospora appendiculata TaxID=314037 RepID=A0AAE1C8R0_9PEZI|nr:hypothetical protein B0T22DRAFT_467613 [Podospora appendiculata]
MLLIFAVSLLSAHSIASTWWTLHLPSRTASLCFACHSPLVALARQSTDTLHTYRYLTLPTWQSCSNTGHRNIHRTRERETASPSRGRHYRPPTTANWASSSIS